MDLFDSLGIPSEPTTKEELYKLKECSTDIYNKLIKSDKDNEISTAGSTITEQIEYVFSEENLQKSTK